MEWWINFRNIKGDFSILCFCILRVFFFLSVFFWQKYNRNESIFFFNFIFNLTFCKRYANNNRRSDNAFDSVWLRHLTLCVVINSIFWLFKESSYLDPKISYQWFLTQITQIGQIPYRLAPQKTVSIHIFKLLSIFRNILLHQI